MSARGKIFAALCAAAGALVALAPFAARQIFSDEVFDGVFGDSLCSLPVQMGGRAMPLSSAAADVLKRVSGKSTAKIGGARVSATKWLWLSPYGEAGIGIFLVLVDSVHKDPIPDRKRSRNYTKANVLANLVSGDRIWRQKQS